MPQKKYNKKHRYILISQKSAFAHSSAEEMQHILGVLPFCILQPISIPVCCALRVALSLGIYTELSALCYTSIKPSFLPWYQNEILNLPHCQYLPASLPVALTLLIDLLLSLHYQRSDKRSRGYSIQASCVSPVVSPPGTAEDLSGTAACSVRTFGN